MRLAIDQPQKQIHLTGEDCDLLASYLRQVSAYHILIAFIQKVYGNQALEHAHLIKECLDTSGNMVFAVFTEDHHELLPDLGNIFWGQARLQRPDLFADLLSQSCQGACYSYLVQQEVYYEESVHVAWDTLIEGQQGESEFGYEVVLADLPKTYPCISLDRADRQNDEFITSWLASRTR